GQMTPPTPSKAAKDETPLQRYERLIKDAARMEIWHNAVGRQIDIASASDVVIKAMYKNSIQRNKVELALKSAREDAIAAQLGSNRSQLT
ncbi:hypothetical protein ACI39X_27490, partial [Klebsiella pneumoniae]|uniref:hypothetical protein n=1 Tax=Klebsiella pneumoniae TaxID=573 RepID=UPI0038537732